MVHVPDLALWQDSGMAASRVDGSVGEGEGIIGGAHDMPQHQRVLTGCVTAKPLLVGMEFQASASLTSSSALSQAVLYRPVHCLQGERSRVFWSHES